MEHVFGVDIVGSKCANLLEISSVADVVEVDVRGSRYVGFVQQQQVRRFFVQNVVLDETSASARATIVSVKWKIQYEKYTFRSRNIRCLANAIDIWENYMCWPATRGRS